MEPFYYQHLTKSEQTIYHAIKTGVTALEDHFLVPYADPARISMIFFLVRLDCPEIFYAVTVKLHIDGRKTAVNMEKVDEAGFFAALVSSKKKLSYTYSVEKVNGEVTEYTDPYAFANVTKPEDYGRTAGFDRH